MGDNLNLVATVIYTIFFSCHNYRINFRHNSKVVEDIIRAIGPDKFPEQKIQRKKNKYYERIICYIIYFQPTSLHVLELWLFSFCILSCLCMTNS